MKHATLLLISIIGVYASPISSFQSTVNIHNIDSPLTGHQVPIMNSFMLSDFGSVPSGDLKISDIIGKEKGINVFASLTREVTDISNRLDSSQKTIVLAPLNSALNGKKTWEDPKGDSDPGVDSFAGPAGKARADDNTKRFVESHVIPVDQWVEGNKIKSLGGEEVWWESKGNKKIVSKHYGALARVVLLTCGRYNLETSRWIEPLIESQTGKYGLLGEY